MREFEVTYEAIIRTTCTIKANNKAEAEEIASNKLITDDDFKGRDIEDPIIIEVEVI